MNEDMQQLLNALLPELVMAIRTEIGTVRSESNAEFASVRAESKAEFATVRAESKAQFEALQANLAAVDGKLAVVDGKLAVLDGKLEAADKKADGIDARVSELSRLTAREFSKVRGELHDLKQNMVSKKEFDRFKSDQEKRFDGLIRTMDELHDMYSGETTAQKQQESQLDDHERRLSRLEQERRT